MGIAVSVISGALARSTVSQMDQTTVGGISDLQAMQRLTAEQRREIVSAAETIELTIEAAGIPINDLLEAPRPQRISLDY